VTPDFPTFAEFFHELFGYNPYAWQEQLAGRLAAGDPPAEITVDTGMGKTQVVTAWTWAFAREQNLITAGSVPAGSRRVPTRLHFVVDRRVIVDDTAALAARIAAALHAGATPSVARVAHALRRTANGGELLSVIKLRGGLPKKPEHTRHLATPAIITSTLDMFASRLLWRGYGVSRGRRSLDAALTGTDTLIVLDEAHLAPQFQATMKDLALQAAEERLFGGTVPPRQFMVATATPTVRGEGIEIDWDEEARRNPAIIDRQANRSGVNVTLHAVETAGDAKLKAVLTHVRELRPAAGEAIVVLCNTVAAAKKVFAGIQKEKWGSDVVAPTVKIVIGGVPDPVVADILDEIEPFRPNHPLRSAARPLIIVATQTLEAGVDIDFDHIITESCSYDAFAQRSGRVNRLGLRPGGTLTVVSAVEPDATKHERAYPVYGAAEHATFAWLCELGEDLTLGRVKDAFAALSQQDKNALMTTAGGVRRLPRHVFEAFLDTENDHVTAPVSPWIRPVDRQRQTVQIAFRDSVALIDDDATLAAHLRQFPIGPWETWTMSVSAAADSGLFDAKKRGEFRMVLIDERGDYRVQMTSGRTDPLEDAANAVIVLGPWPEAPETVGLDRIGEDLSRYRLRGENPMVLVGAGTRHRVAGADEDADSGELSVLFDTAAADTSTTDLFAALTAADALTWAPVGDGIWAVSSDTEPDLEDSAERYGFHDHLHDVGAEARRVAELLGLPDTIVNAIETAGVRHDLGKLHPAFQRSLSYVLDGAVLTQEPPAEPLAKSSLPSHVRRAAATLAGVTPGFRHEALSVHLSDALGYDEAGTADLTRYLIATHHGSLRSLPPAIDAPKDEADGEYANPLQDATSADWTLWPETIRRTTAEHGPYTLACAEAILRFADWAESARAGETR
jgi:CRISPR-associated endonuclease/helicase Cas3